MDHPDHPDHPDRESLRRPKVLIVEDEPRLRELLLDVVPEMGFDAAAARTAEEAGRLMSAERRDILILDLQLPLMHGMDLFRAVRERWPRTQVIVLTGFGDLDAARAAIRLDVVDFLTKPCHLHDVEVALDRARRRMVEAMAAATRDDDVLFRPAPPAPPGEGGRPETLEDIERREILKALARNAGNRTKAAAELGISRRMLHYRLAAYGRERARGDD
jgi:DNA-binding NtrC family response regulator